jgi:hypothetical protein
MNTSPLRQSTVASMFRGKSTFLSRGYKVPTIESGEQPWLVRSENSTLFQTKQSNASFPSFCNEAPRHTVLHADNDVEWLPQDEGAAD